MSCKFRLLYHIILVVKYRKKLLLTYGNLKRKVFPKLIEVYELQKW
jgi:REP element-mobilizing transposase RayT